VIRVAFAVALLGAGAACAQAPYAVEDLMRSLAAGGDSTVAFTETRYSSALKMPLVTSGELRYTRPAQLERRVRTPVEERYLVDGDRVTIERKGAPPRTVSIASQPALGAFLESIRATAARRSRLAQALLSASSSRVQRPVGRSCCSRPIRSWQNS